MPIAVDILKRFWEQMGTNDFHSVGPLLGDDFVLEWPQSGERIRGRDNFVAMNVEYPAYGKWQFTVHRIVGTDTEAVSEVSLTDGTQHARVISFVTVKDGKITKNVEFWPDPFPPPDNRKHLIEMM